MLLPEQFKLHPCDLCDRKYDSNAGLRKHKRTMHRPERKADHNNIDADRKKFVCSLCNAAFALQFSLRRHEDTEHRVAPRRVQCGRCSLTFVRESEFKMHEKLCSTLDWSDVGGANICAVCKRSFGNVYILTRHFLRHCEESAQFRCNKCNKSYKDKVSLDRHRRTHSHGPQYQSDQCEKSFAHKSSLERHIRSHTEVTEEHVCPHCRKVFPLKHSLKVHLLTHTGVKSHKCSECGKSFSQKSHLDCHLKTHGKHVRWCEHCGRSFNLLVAFEKHVKSHDVSNTISSQKNKPSDCSIFGKLLSYSRNIRIQLHCSISIQNIL